MGYEYKVERIMSNRSYEKELKEHIDKLEKLFTKEEIIGIIKAGHGKFEVPTVMDILENEAKWKMKDDNFELFDFISEDEFEDYIRKNIPEVKLNRVEKRYLYYK